MKMLHVMRWLVVLACLISLAGNAQTADSLYRIETTDGNEFVGKIVEQNQTEIKLKTEKLGVLTIKRMDIMTMQAITGKKVAGQFWFNNPQSTRHFWSPNGYGLKKGEGYYQNVWIFANQVSAGLSDNVTIGVGMVPLFLFGGAPTPVWITPKVSFPLSKDKVNIGLGVLAGTVIAGSDWGDGGGTFGVAYGITTFGSRDKNVSVGIGYGYADGSWAAQPTFTFSAIQRVSDKGYFITENYVFPRLTMLSIGGRRLVKRVSIDFGLFVPIDVDMDVFVAIPWLGIAVPFQKKQ